MHFHSLGWWWVCITDSFKGVFGGVRRELIERKKKKKKELGGHWAGRFSVNMQNRARSTPCLISGLVAVVIEQNAGK